MVEDADLKPARPMERIDARSGKFSLNDSVDAEADADVGVNEAWWDERADRDGRDEREEARFRAFSARWESSARREENVDDLKGWFVAKIESPTLSGAKVPPRP